MANAKVPIPKISNAKVAIDYDPHLHRQLKNPTNNWETLIHLLKCSLGTGILAMPQAFSKAGLVIGSIGTVVIGILITHCLQILIRSQYAACKHNRVALLAYPASMSACVKMGPKCLHPFSGTLAIAVDVFLVVYQLGVCCVYIVFMADNIKKMIDPYYKMALEIHMLIILLPLVIFNLIPSLKLLAPFSAFANFITFVGLGVIVYCVLTNDMPLEPGQKQGPIDLWGSAAKFPLFFGTVLFALTSVGVVVAVENNMKTPKSFGKPFGVLNIAMAIIIVVYTIVGALGYVYCLSHCSDSITLDMPKGGLSTTVMVTFVVAIFISYGLHCYVPVEVVWRGYILPHLEKKNASDKKKTVAEFGLRIFLCLFTFILAITVPRLGLFISLFGALCLSALGLCFPALMEICVSYPSKFGVLKMKLHKDIILFIVGLLGLVAGTYAALDAIVRSFM